MAFVTELSTMDCYAGKIRVEITGVDTIAGTPDGIFERDTHFYLQFVEGCGYDVKLITPEEAIKLGEALITAGNQAKALLDNDNHP